MNRWLGPALVRAERPHGSTPAPSGRCRGSTSPTGPTTPRRSTDYAGQRGTVYYETRPVTVVVNGRRQTTMQQVARIRWQPARGRVARDFDDVLVLGSKSLPKRFTDALAPWDLSVLTPYEPKFLAGFRAEGYTVPVEEGYGEARGSHERGDRAATCAPTSAATSSASATLATDVGGADLQARALAGLARRLPLPRQELPLRGQRPHRRRSRASGPYSAVKIAVAVAIALVVAGLIAYVQIAGNY